LNFILVYILIVSPILIYSMNIIFYSILLVNIVNSIHIHLFYYDYIIIHYFSVNIYKIIVRMYHILIFIFPYGYDHLKYETIMFDIKPI
jgi:hypothetical protein